MTQATVRPRTVGELRASGYRQRSVKDELRANLIARIRAGEDLFPGIVGYDKTVIPQLENAILSRHDFILLGLRGQAKTRILRQLQVVPRRSDPGGRGLRDPRRAARRRSARRAAAARRSSATRCRSRGSVATSATARSSPRPTSRSPT